MNRSEYIALMEDPSRMDRRSINDLEEMIEMFPYFQGAYMLLLKGLVDSEDVGFDNKLHKYAYCVADRELLYYFLTQKKEEKDVVEQKTEEEVVKENEELLAIEKEDNKTLTENESSDLIDLAGEIEKKEFPSEIQSDVDLSGMDDLLVIEDFKEDENAFWEQTDDKKSDDEYGKMSQGDLIDKFIETNPRITPRMNYKASQQQNDVQSEDENLGLVSETLAKIYVKQEYYAKAIDIYQKLSLKYPEKSSYFADQILKIKKIINS